MDIVVGTCVLEETEKPSSDCTSSTSFDLAMDSKCPDIQLPFEYEQDIDHIGNGDYYKHRYSLFQRKKLHFRCLKNVRW